MVERFILFPFGNILFALNCIQATGEVFHIVEKRKDYIAKDAER